MWEVVQKHFCLLNRVGLLYRVTFANRFHQTQKQGVGTFVCYSEWCQDIQAFYWSQSALVDVIDDPDFQILIELDVYLLHFEEACF